MYDEHGNKIKIQYLFSSLAIPRLGNGIENVIFIHTSIRFKYTSYIYHNLDISCGISPWVEDSLLVSLQRTKKETIVSFKYWLPREVPRKNVNSHQPLGIPSSSYNVFNKNRVVNWNSEKNLLLFSVILNWEIEANFSVIEENSIELQTNSFE